MPAVVRLLDHNVVVFSYPRSDTLPVTYVAEFMVAGVVGAEYEGLIDRENTPLSLSRVFMPEAVASYGPYEDLDTKREIRAGAYTIDLTKGEKDGIKKDACGY